MPKLGRGMYWIALSPGERAPEDVYHMMLEAPVRPARSAAEAVSRLPEGLRSSCVLYRMNYFRMKCKPLTQKILDKAKLFTS